MFLFQQYNLKKFNLQVKVMNAYIRILKAQPSINEREDGYAYLETTYNANMICGDTIASLRNKEEGNFRLYRTLTYLNNDMVPLASYYSYKWLIWRRQTSNEISFLGLLSNQH